MSHFHCTNILTHPVVRQLADSAHLFNKRGGGKADCGLRDELLIKYDIKLFLLLSEKSNQDKEIRCSTIRKQLGPELIEAKV